MNVSQRVLSIKTVVALLLTILCVGCMPMSKLQKAVKSGSISEVDDILAHGESINEVNPLHGTAMTVAVESSNMPMVRHLLDKGADVNLGTPLSSAAYLGNMDLARLLIEKGASPNFRGHGNLPIIYASEQNHGNMVGLLLSAGANPNGDDNKDCPADIASFRGYDDVLSRLLEAGTDPSMCMYLDRAVRHSPSLLTTRLLLEYGADVNARDESGMTALHFAALFGKEEHAVLLLEFGAKPELVDKSGKIALDYARENKYARIVTILLKNTNR